VDRRVKERLIGACILVVLAVALVPELLSGPKPAVPADAAADAVRLPAGAPDPVRNVTVDLGAAQAASGDTASGPPAPAQQLTSADAASSAVSRPPSVAQVGAAPTGAAPTGAAPTAAMSPVSAPPDGAPSHVLETPAALPTSGQTFTVQLGSFANRSNADKLVHQLKAQGFALYVNTEGSGPAARYRVRMGPLADRAAAERMITKLEGLGQSATIVSPR
jgi:DedD protein